MELLTKLGINWQLLLAQIVNFLIVLGVLGIFVYKPILNLLDARSERIRKSMDDVKAEIEQKIGPEMAQKQIDAIKGKTAITFDQSYFGK